MVSFEFGALEGFWDLCLSIICFAIEDCLVIVLSLSIISKIVPTILTAQSPGYLPALVAADFVASSGPCTYELRYNEKSLVNLLYIED